MQATASPADPTQRLLNGQAWADFCDGLKRAGEQVLRPDTPENAFDRAEGWRYLTRLTRLGLHLDHQVVLRVRVEQRREEVEDVVHAPELPRVVAGGVGRRARTPRGRAR